MTENIFLKMRIFKVINLFADHIIHIIYDGEKSFGKI